MREEFLFKRSLPQPVPYAILHGPHTRVEKETVFRRWWHIDCEGKVMGRIAQEVARVIMGKHKPIYDPSLLMGDYVVVTNVDKMHIGGKKLDYKMRRWYTGYPGGLQEVAYGEMMKNKPDQLLRMVIHFCLPRNALRRERLKFARIFTGPTHPHTVTSLSPPQSSAECWLRLNCTHCRVFLPLRVFVPLVFVCTHFGFFGGERVAVNVVCVCVFVCAYLCESLVTHSLEG